MNISPSKSSIREEETREEIIQQDVWNHSNSEVSQQSQQQEQGQFKVTLKSKKTAAVLKQKVVEVSEQQGSSDVYSTNKKGQG